MLIQSPPLPPRCPCTGGDALQPGVLCHRGGGAEPAAPLGRPRPRAHRDQVTPGPAGDELGGHGAVIGRDRSAGGGGGASSSSSSSLIPLRPCLQSLPPSWCPALLWSGAEDCDSPHLSTTTDRFKATTIAPITRPLLEAATATPWPLTLPERARKSGRDWPWWRGRCKHYRNSFKHATP